MHEASAAMWFCLADPEVLEACGLALECSVFAHADVPPGDEQQHLAQLLDGCVLSLVAPRSDRPGTHKAHPAKQVCQDGILKAFGKTTCARAP